ncbi:MAG: hypothetical protein U0529_22685 [Thermoanaerobaculia bacterium]
MTQRHPGILLGVWLGMAPIAFPVSAGEVPVVRFVEVGDSGVVFTGEALYAGVELTTSAPFRGTLVTTYRWSRDPAWIEGVSWGDRVLRPLELAAGRTVVEIELPCPIRASSSPGPELPFEVVWTLEDSDGTSLTHGTQPARLAPGPELRVLHLTRAPGDGHRRPPALAWSKAARYAPYAFVLVSRDDLRALDAGQRSALFDAVALGLTLVVTPSAGNAEPFGPLGLPFDDVLRHERVTFTADAGGEIRESPLLWGRIRRTTLVPVAPRDIDDPALVPWMLLTAPPARPDVLRTFRPGEGRWDSKPLERARGARVGALSSFVPAAVVLALFLVASRKRDRPPRWPVAASVAACLVSPLLLYAVLSGARAANSDWRFRVAVNDGLSRVACVGTYESKGGGGGSGAVVLDLGSTDRAACVTGSLDRLTLSPLGPRGHRVTTSRNVVTPHSLTLAFTRTIGPPDPLWEADLRLEGGRPTGTLRARRPVKDSWVLGLRDFDGAHVGPVPAGGTVDVSTLPVVRDRNGLYGPLEGLSRAWMGRTGAWLLPVSWTYWAEPGFSATFVVSEEPPGEDGSARYDYQGLRPAGAPLEALLELPALLRGNEVHVFVPLRHRLPDDAPFLLAAYPSWDSSPARAERFEKASDGVRLAVLDRKGRSLEVWWRQLRPDLPKAAGFVAVRWKEGS